MGLPTGFEDRVNKNAVRCRGRVVAVDDSGIQQFGMVKSGDQEVTLRVLDGPFKGRTLQGNNPLLGQMDRDKVFAVGDTALVVLSLDKDGRIVFVNPQARYRIGFELALLGLLALMLIVFGGMTGAKALLSFLFSGLMLWKVLVPLMLKGYDPVWLSLGVVTLLTAVILFLVAGLTRKGLVKALRAGLRVGRAVAAP